MSIINLPTPDMLDYMKEVHAAHTSGVLKLNNRRMQAVPRCQDPYTMSSKP